MTYDFTETSSPLNDREHSPLPTRTHPESRAVLPSSFKKTKETYDEDIEKQRWENEGGANAHGVDSLARRYGMIESNPIIEMVDDAFDQLDDSDRIDEAVETVRMAMLHAHECHSQVKDLVRYSIDRLSTINGPADPPHPGALSLVKQRQKLAL